jgi:hypothetical protein
VNVDTSDVHVNAGQTATVTGTFSDPNGQAVTLSSSVGTVHDDGGGAYTWSFPTGPAPSQIVYVTATDTSGVKGQIAFSLDINDLGPPVLKLPGSKTAHTGSKLSFTISAADPDAADKITFGATGLPAGLTFKDNGDGTGAVSGKVTAKPATYTATFAASDGKNPSVTGTVKLKITPKAELSLKVGKHVTLKNGAIKLGCAALHKTLKTCAAVVVIAGKKVGSATVRIKHKGKKSATVTINLNRSARRAIAHAKHGVKVTIKLTAHEFGSTKTFKATGSTTVGH